MLTVDEALRLLFSDVPPPEIAVESLREAEGAILAEEVAGDLDMPPFDKALMDGYAVIAADRGELEILEEIPAGHVPSKTVTSGHCSKIMTGAPLPKGADAVQQVELTVRAGSRVKLLEPVERGKNVAAAGQDLRKGEVVARSGRKLGPPEIGVLAAVGRSRVKVFRRPTVALVVTGDEIVEPDVVPREGQIRNSNASSIGAQVRAMGLSCDYLGIVGDNLSPLRDRIKEGLKRDVLLLSGGVSKGDWDLVIPALQSEGVKHSMHQVRIKPGRPLFFGTQGRRRIFGLPGNPVSTLVTFEVFVRPFLGRMMGNPAAGRPRVRARLLEPLPRKNDREQYLPASVQYREGEVQAMPLHWRGSADLFTVARADGFVVVPIDTAYPKGALVEVLLLT